MDNLDPRRARWIKVRMGLLCGLMGLGLGLIVSSAYSVQIEDGPEWREMAERQRQRRLHVIPKRGSVYDRNGTALAVTVEVPSVSMDALEVLRGYDEKRAAIVAKDAAARLAEALSLDAAELEHKIVQRRRFVWVKRRISKEEVDAIRALSDVKQAVPIRGLTIEGEGHRFYPNRELLGPLIGFVSPDGEGKDGLEYELDGELKGHVEQVRGLRDRSGRLLFSDGVEDEQALAGHNVYLTHRPGHSVRRRAGARCGSPHVRGQLGSGGRDRPQHRRDPRTCQFTGLQPQRLFDERRRGAQAIARSPTVSSPAAP